MNCAISRNKNPFDDFIFIFLNINNSEDLGLTVMTKSGIAVKFVIVDIEKYQDEIVKWVLIPTDSAIHKMPGLKNTRLIINNV
jgi:hypothetical protein